MLVERGCAVTMVASGPPSPGHRFEVVRYKTIPMIRGISILLDFFALVRWIRFLRTVRPDGVTAGSPKAGLLVMVAARICRVPVRQYQVWGCRWDRGRGLRCELARLAERLACDCATDVVAVSGGVRNLLQNASIARGRVRVLGRGGSKGVDLGRFIPPIERAPGSPPTIGFAGRLARDKGVDLLPEILRGVRARVPSARLLVAGAPDAADPCDEQTHRELSAMEGVTLLGAVTDMPAFFQSIDVFCLPTLREGLPSVVLEAAACHVPTVAWRVTGLEDAVTDGETGFLCAYGDLESMIQNITTLLHQDSKRHLFGSAARRHAEEHFAADTVQGRSVDDLVAQVVAAARD